MLLVIVMLDKLLNAQIRTRGWFETTKGYGGKYYMQLIYSLHLDLQLRSSSIDLMTKGGVNLSQIIFNKTENLS